MTMLDKMEQGEWILVQAFDKVGKLKKLQSKHASRQKKLPGKAKVPFHHPTTNVSSGYILWKDSKTMIFNSNNLVEIPSKPIRKGTSAQAIQCVNGLAEIKHWTGTE